MKPKWLSTQSTTTTSTTTVTTTTVTTTSTVTWRWKWLCLEKVPPNPLVDHGHHGQSVSLFYLYHLEIFRVCTVLHHFQTQMLVGHPDSVASHLLKSDRKFWPSPFQKFLMTILSFGWAATLGEIHVSHVIKAFDCSNCVSFKRSVLRLPVPQPPRPARPPRPRPLPRCHGIRGRRQYPYFTNQL